MHSLAARKYFAVYRSGLVSALVYKWDFLLGYFSKFLSFFVSVAVWSAVARGANRPAMGADAVVSYFCAVMLVNAFTACESRFSDWVRTGDLALHIPRPYHPIPYEMATLLSAKTCALAKHLPFYLFVAAAYPGAFAVLSFPWYAPVFLALGFLICYFMSLMIQLLSLWLVNVTGIAMFVLTFTGIVNGQRIPYAFLPAALVNTLDWLPFQFMTYYPTSLLTGAASPEDVGIKLALAAGYCALLYLGCFALYRRGMKRYTASGG